MRSPVLFLLCCCLPWICTAQRGDRPGEVQPPPPVDLEIPPAPVLTPAEALGAFEVAPGLRVELIAAEPLVRDPVAITFDPEGRMWVVEMTGYMPNVDGEGEDEPVGSIAILNDVDGDGVMDERTVFLDQLVLPRAIGLVAGGVLVAEPPHLWFCRDVDGDGRADEKTEVASDYGATGNPEHKANGLLRGIDNWIYSAKFDVRFRYEQGEWRREATASRGQWGITQDDFGRLLYNENSDPVRGDLLPGEWMIRNPHLANPAGVAMSLAPDRSAYPIRVTPGINRGYQLLGADQKLPSVTAAGGVVAYRGGIFPADFANNFIVCEPSGNLVQRYVWTEQDGRRIARNAYGDEKRELLASTDERFRPVNSAIGPDGGLYLVDMYRGVIQHRVFVTTYLRNQIIDRGLENPIGLGRIWRIVPEEADLFPRPSLSDASAPELVATLSHENGWWRDTAQRLLVERSDPVAVALLRDLATTGGNELGRLHALWTLEGIHALDVATLRTAWDDASVAIRTAAFRLGTQLLGGDDREELQAVLIAHAEGSDVELRRHAALALGEFQTSEAEDALLGLLRRWPSESLLVDAVISGLAGRELAFIERLIDADPGEDSAAVARLAGCVVRERDPSRLERLLALTAGPTTEWGRAAILDGVERVVSPGRRRSRRARRNFELEIEPSGLLALAARSDDPLAERAVALLATIDWPGKPGAAEAVEPLTAEQEALFTEGRTTFNSLCAACHQARGQGIPGLSKPIVGSRWAVGSERALIRIVLQGKRSELPAPMPPLAALTDRQIAGVLTYLRRSWGNEADPVSPESVAEIRAATEGRVESWTDEELEPFDAL